MSVLAVLAAVALAWDIFLAGQIAQQRKAPWQLAALSGLAALLAAPALVIAVATSSTLTGRSVAGVAWIWPGTVAIFVAQAMYATGWRLVTPLVGVPIVLYDLLLMSVAATRLIGGGGGSPPEWALALNAAYTTAIGIVAGPTALASPYALLVPLVAPAFPARWRVSRPLRLLFALLATAWVGAAALSLPQADRAVRSYDRYALESLQMRPAGDFAVGVRVLPPVDAPPSPVALRNDLALVDTTGAEVVSIIVLPEGAHATALDSLARVFDPLRRDSTTLIVTLGYPPRAARSYRLSPHAYETARLGDIQRIARRLHPDYLLPADEPYGRGVLALGRLPVAAWTHYLAAASRAARAIDPRIKVGIAASSFDASDSALFHWAADSLSPMDAVGFTFFPEFGGAASLDARMHTADRWMRRRPDPGKEQWVFAAGGYPAAHGEDAQLQAVWGEIAWGANRGGIKGVVIAEAADYGDLTGLRAASGRLRPAVTAITRATRTLRGQ